MPFDPREAFIGEAVRLDSPLGALDLGIVDADAPGIAEGVSRLLMRSIQDARAERGGHLPSWLVRDIERNYISPEKVRTLWAKTGHRFALVLDRAIVGTIHVAKSDRVILTVDRHVINVDESEHPGFKPPRHHHVVNVSVRHELRRARLGRRMVEAIVSRFRHLFAGEGLWVRADPPWHPGLAGLGFVHDPKLDVFLPPSAERTADLPHDVFNRRYACDCAPKRPELATHKLQYVSMTRPFARAASATTTPRDVPALEAPAAEDGRDYGGVFRLMPRAVARPSSIDELAAILAWATREERRVTVRGRGMSHAGQSLGDDVVVSTEDLTRIEPQDSGVSVEGGCTWRALADVSARLPVVVPTIADASIGGTLSSLGIGIGSPQAGLAIDHVTSLLVVTGDGRKVWCDRDQAGWLFDAALGGYGQFGVIARAVLRQTPRAVTFEPGRPTPHDDLASVLAAFDARPVAASARVTATGFVLRRSGDGDVALPAHVRALPRETNGGLVVQVIVPRAALVPLVAHVRASVDLDDDSVFIHPFLEHADRPGLFIPRVAPGELVFALTLTHGASKHLRDALVAEARRLGGAPTLQGGAPDLRAHLGADYEKALVAKRLADPANVLTSPYVSWGA
ncbi:MAG: FAD-binding oxidoreductase [Labilithrix sp.]|nr:FAD-binding oxidoreductase [Labilithrix sp.]MCW5810120.1 FAD-binding oxidoreductase [Labilithrix sp.]